MITGFPLDILKQIAGVIEEEKDIAAFALSCKKLAEAVEKTYKKITEYYPIEDIFVISESKIENKPHYVKNLSIEVQYIKNTLRDTPPKKKSADDVIKYANKKTITYFYVDISHYKNVKSVYVKECGQSPRHGQIIFKMPPKCRRFIVDQKMSGFLNFAFMESAGVCVIKELAALQHNVHLLTENIRIYDTLKMRHLFDKEDRINVKEVLNKYAGLRNISITYYTQIEKIAAFSNKKIREMSLTTEGGGLDFILDCPRLCYLELSIVFLYKDKKKFDNNCSILDAPMEEYLKESAIVNLSRSAAILYKSFIENKNLNIINIRDNRKAVVQCYIGDVLEYLKNAAYVVIEEAALLDVIKYCRFIVNMAGYKEICIICGQVYISPHLDIERTRHNILLMIELLKSAKKVEKGLIHEAAIPFGGEDIIINKNNIAAFSEKRISKYFKDSGPWINTPWREYFH